MILVHDEVEEEDGDGGLVADEGDETEQGVVEINQMAEISLNSVFAWTTSKTMKLRGQLQGQDETLLIDPGATHNFIATELVNHLQISVTNTEAYGVTMGTGVAVKGQGICRGVNLQV